MGRRNRRARPQINKNPLKPPVTSEQLDKMSSRFDALEELIDKRTQPKVFEIKVGPNFPYVHANFNVIEISRKLKGNGNSDASLDDRLKNVNPRLEVDGFQVPGSFSSCLTKAGYLASGVAIGSLITSGYVLAGKVAIAALLAKPMVTYVDRRLAIKEYTGLIRDLDNASKQEEKIAPLTQLIRLGHNLASNYLERGKIYHSQDVWDKAEHDFLASIAIASKDPNSFDARFNNYDFIGYNSRAYLSSVYLKQGKLQESIALLTEGLRFTNKHKNGLLEARGLDYQNIGETDLALQDYSDAFDLGNGTALMRYLRLAFNKDRHDKLAEGVEKVMSSIDEPALKKYKSEIWFFKGALSVHNQQHNQSVEYFKQSVRFEPVYSASQRVLDELRISPEVVTN